MNRSVVAAFLALMASGCNGCKRTPRAPPPPRASRSDGGVSSANRPVFPAQSLSTNARRDCFPEDFRSSRVKLRGALIELCGVTGGAPRCYEIDPIANRVEETRVTDAPSSAGSEPEFVGPFQRTEISSHGWRASTRGGSLSVTGPAGNHRSVTAQGFGFHAYDNISFLPWTDGWYLVLVAWKGTDLGATAIIDPFTLRMISHSALLPCGRDS